MALIFHKYPLFSLCQVLSRPVQPENENAAFLEITADAVAGLPLPGLRRMGEQVRSTRLQTFLTVLNFHPLSRKLENRLNVSFFHQFLAHEASVCAVCRCKTIFPYIDRPYQALLQCQ